jgi:hypothetical protein
MAVSALGEGIAGAYRQVFLARLYVQSGPQSCARDALLE